MSEEYFLEEDSAALSHISWVSFPRLTSFLPEEDPFSGEEDPLEGDDPFLNIDEDDEEEEKGEDGYLEDQDPE